MGAAVERHVLDEVREALLVVRFLERTVFTASRSETRFSGRPLRRMKYLSPFGSVPVLIVAVERQDGLRVDRRQGRGRLLRQQPIGAATGTSSASAKTSRGGAREAVEYAHGATLLRERGVK